MQIYVDLGLEMQLPKDGDGYAHGEEGNMFILM